MPINIENENGDQLLKQEMAEHIAAIFLNEKDDLKRITALKKYLSQFKEYLNSFGFDPGYLAYVIEAAVDELQQEHENQNRN